LLETFNSCAQQPQKLIANKMIDDNAAPDKPKDNSNNDDDV